MFFSCPRVQSIRAVAMVMVGWIVCVAAPVRGELVAGHFERAVIYHSPQKPGWTSWVGAWVMPDNSLMVSCTQATGALEDRETPRSFKGVHVSVIYLRSSDAGKSWTKVADSDVSFGTGEHSGLGTHANNGGTTIALKDGSLVRRVYGCDYGRFDLLPGTAFMQRSTDLGRSWSDPPTTSDGGRTWMPGASLQQLLLDPAKFTVQVTRLRRLSDGRLLLGGGVWKGPHTQSAPYAPLLMVSDDEARTWRRVEFAGPHYEKSWDKRFDEWDFCELDDGDLLIVSRPHDGKRRWVGVMKKKGRGWVLDDFRQSELPHSGHPELLRTREGPVLHVAQTGIDWTVDGGRHWSPVIFPGLDRAYRPQQSPRSLATLYYPRSLQMSDGTIFVFAHRGWDNEYGKYDQAVVMDKFRLVGGY